MKIVSPVTLAMISLIFLSGCTPQVHHPRNFLCEPRLEHQQFITGDGTVLPVRSWLPQNGRVKAVVIALHGFNDYSNAFAASGTYFSSHGIACYAYDQRGFGNAPNRGRWAGIDAYSRDLSGFATEIRKLYLDVPLYVLGESMGGAVTIVAMTGSNPPAADGLILVAPAVWARETMPWYQRWVLAVASHTVPWLELTGKGLNVIPSDNMEMRRGLAHDPLVIKSTRIDAMYGLTNLMDAALSRADKLTLPTLVQYGKNDQIIPKEPIMQMLAKTPTSTRKAFYENGYHMLLRDLQGDKPLADIVAWIDDRSKPLPYGSDQWD